MDPSTWIDPYTHLRVPGNTQLNSGSHAHQFTHNRNLHQINHMTAFNNVNCQKNINHTKSQKMQMNQLSSMNMSNHANNQQLMNGHYNTSSNGSWFFNSRQQHTNHDNSLQIRNFENGNTSFNHNPFSLHSHSVYDPGFMSASFSQQSKSSNYLSAASDFMHQMKKADSNINFRNASSYCSSMKGINMGEMSNSCNTSLRDPNLAASSFFSSRSLSAATNAWHQPNFMQSNNQNNSVVQHDSPNIVNSQNSSNLSNGCNMNACANSNASMNVLCGKMSSNVQKSHLVNNHDNNTANVNHQYKNAPVAPFSNMPLNSNNSFMMQNFPLTRSGQNSFVNPSIGAKIAAADHYTSLAFAAAMNSEYAFQQQSKNQQYMSSMNNFTHNHNTQSGDYNVMSFDSSNFNSNHHSNSLINYCPTSLFPMSNSDSSINSNFKNHDTFLEDYSQLNSVANNVPTKGQTQKSRKNVSNQKMNQSKTVGELNDNYSDYVIPPSCNGMSNNCLNGTSNTGVSSNNVSRCSSVASTHQMQQNDSYSYNYSPATTNISAHSPYQQRSSTSNSSHSSGNSCAISNGAQDYLNYGTPNSAPPTVFPSIGTSQTPTPTPGYPTPPSSVGHSNSRCNSNEELSPFSNNSMSSNISQPYSRNDYKSSSSSSSQISPKQMDSGISDNLQFNSSCMVVSQKGTIPNTSSQHKPIHNSSSMYTPNVINNPYKSQQYSVSYQNHHTNSASSNSCSNDPYSNFSSENASISLSQDTLMTNDDRITLSSNSSYEYNYQETQDDQFSGGFNDKSDMQSCVQHLTEPNSLSSNSHLISHSNEAKSDFHSTSPDLTSHDNFDLSFDSVIQPIDVNLSNSHVEQQNVPNQTNSSDIAMDSLNNDKSTFPSIDDLSFISPPSESSLNEKHDDYSLDNPIANEHTSNQMGHCKSLDFQPSHDDNSLIVDSSSIECNNIQSIIDSLPKSEEPCLHVDKNSNNNELINDCTTADNYLSDLAPLMNDNSKIALMESTFKSNELPTIDHDTAPFDDKLNKVIFGDNEDLKINSSITFAKQEEENQFKDVDDFLKTNFKDNTEEIFDKNKTDINQESVSPQFKSVATEITPVDVKVSLKAVNTTNKAISKSNKSNQQSSKKIIPVVPPVSKDESKSVKRKLGNANINTNVTSKKIKKEDVSDKCKTSKKVNLSKNVKSKSVETPLKVAKKQNGCKSNKPFPKKSTKEKVTSLIAIVPPPPPPPPQSLSKPSTPVDVTFKACFQQKKSVKTIMEKYPNIKPKLENVENEKFPNINQPESNLTASETKENVKNLNNNTPKDTKLNVLSSNKSNNLNKTLNEKLESKLVISTSSKILEKPKCESAKNVKQSKPLPKKSTSISPKQSLKGIVSTNSNALLKTTNIINPSCINPKPVNSTNFMPSSTNPTLSNVAPTLIVNQNPSVNSYQVSPVTNAVLISIHPANSTPISSLTAPSTFITLTSQSVTSATCNTTTTTSGATQNTSSRRRSQDKKVATIREGLMRTGDFVVSEEESHLELPVIWRIEGKSLLQRFEHSKQNGITVYTNTSSVCFQLYFS